VTNVYATSVVVNVRGIISGSGHQTHFSNKPLSKISHYKISHTNRAAKDTQISFELSKSCNKQFLISLTTRATKDTQIPFSSNKICYKQTLSVLLHPKFYWILKEKKSLQKRIR